MASHQAGLNPTEQHYVEYLNDLMHQVNQAEVHIYIGDYLSQHRQNLRLGHGFFNKTEKAHFDAALLHLCNIFDRNRKSISIRKLLKHASDHLDMFSFEDYMRRQEGRGAADLAEERYTPITRQDINRDKTTIDELEYVINTARKWRNEVCAHRDEGTLLNKGSKSKLRSIPSSEVERVTSTIFGLLTKYSLGFDFTSYQREKEGRHDVEDVMALIMKHQP